MVGHAVVERKETLSAVQIGLLMVALVWFLYSFRATFLSTVNVNEYAYLQPSLFRTWTQITDYSGAIGLISRTLTSLISVVALALFFTKRISLASDRKILRWLLVGESIYWLSLFLSGVMAFLPIPIGPGFPLGFPVEAGIPCLFESIAIPIALIALIYQLGPGKTPKNAVRWALVAGSIYLFAFWLNNTCNWLYVGLYTSKGWAYIMGHWENVLSFSLTTIGLLALAIYAAYFTWKSFGTATFGELKIRMIGTIVTLFGLYYLWNYLTWIFFGNDQLWSDWYSLLLGHNMNLWLLSLPIVGIALIIGDSVSAKGKDLKFLTDKSEFNAPARTYLNQRHAGKLLLAGQGLGIIFLAIFVGAYLGGLPGFVVLQSEPVFRLALQIFGGLFLFLVLCCLVLMTASKKK
jgi:hypothetical protein